MRGGIYWRYDDESPCGYFEIEDDAVVVVYDPSDFLRDLLSVGGIETFYVCLEKNVAVPYCLDLADRFTIPGDGSTWTRFDSWRIVDGKKNG